MKIITVLFILISNTLEGQTKYQKDFLEVWNDYNENFAYFSTQHIDWNKVKEIFQPLAATIQNDDDFVRLLEQLTMEFHNGHVSLNRNLPSSNRIIPSGADMFVERKENKYILSDLRKGWQ